MAVASIPGFNVHKISKDRYAVSVNNGNMGACVVNKEQLKQIADVYGGKVNDGSTTKKVLGGLAVAGALTAAIVYRKNIGEFFKGLKNGKAGEILDAAKTKAGEVVDEAKGAVKSGKIKETAGKWYNKAADWVVDKWHKVVDFFKGIFAKNKPETGEKVGAFSRLGESIKKGWNSVKTFVKNTFGKNTDDRISYGPLKNKTMKEAGDEVIKNFNKDNRASWLKTFSKRYPESTIEIMPR